MSLHHAEYGQDNDATVILLHGGGGAGWMWRPQVEALRGAYHLLVPDLPEQGLSMDAGPFTMKRAAAMVAELVRERAHGATAHVVGLSSGAQVGVQLLALVVSPEHGTPTGCRLVDTAEHALRCRRPGRLLR